MIVIENLELRKIAGIMNDNEITHRCPWRQSCRFLLPPGFEAVVDILVLYMDAHELKLTTWPRMLKGCKFLLGR